MNNIVLGRSFDPVMNNNILHSMFRFRHKVFRENLGWEVESRDDMERDSFDDLNPVYLLSQNAGTAIEGTSRLLPTTGPYMLKNTFPQLLRGEPAPQDPSIWEISRLAVLPESSNSKAQANIGSITFEMFKAGVEFADRNGIQNYVFVTSVALERLLRQAGLPIYRFGDKKAQRVGKVLSVACWLPINDCARKAVGLPAFDSEAA